MQFLGIGPLEFLLIIVIAIIVLGPKGMIKAARETGRMIRRLIHSPLWRDVMETSREIRDLPNKIAREAGIEEDLEEFRRSTRNSLYDIDRSIYPEFKSHDGPIPHEDQLSSDQSHKDDIEA